MLGKALFAMAFHCHQPVDNFGWEFERAYSNAYLPLISGFEDHPGIKASFHYSGNVLEWLERDHPEYIERLASLVRRGQIEMLGGGCFEPVLAMIPEKDRGEQIRLNEEILGRLFGVKPRGVWIAEKVWEPELADTLVRSGVDYTIVDDYHIFRAGLGEDKVYGPCRTSGKSGDVALFPSLTRLRYYMPFKQPQVTADFLKRIAESRKGAPTCFFFADDGEKFGAWPYTYWWVHKKGWLKRFFKMLEDNSLWLSTATYSEVLDSVPLYEAGEVPHSSYAEMMEWSGGSFSNFFRKYPEAGRMRGRMLSVSGILGEAEASGVTEGLLGEARRELYKAQTGCAYWHGTFGGVYLPHLRSGVYSHLISAELLAENASGRDESAVISAERDNGGSARETLVRNRFLDVFLAPASGGALAEVDHKPSRVNLTNIFSRVREDYHDKLDRGNSGRLKEARRAILRGDFADVHDVLGVRERGLSRMLEYDDHRRLSFLTHVFKEDRRPGIGARWQSGHERFLKGEYASRTRKDGDGITVDLWRRDRVYASSARTFDLEVAKSVTLGASPVIVLSQSIIRHSGSQPLPQYAVEFNFSLWDDTVMSGRKMPGVDRFFLQDGHNGLKADFRLNRVYDVILYPLYTVNETEAGLVKTFQGVSVCVCDTRRYDGVLETPKMEIEIAIERVC